MNHWGLFLTTVLAQGNDEQVVAWALRAFSMQIIGCYAQTELGVYCYCYCVVCVYTPPS